MYIHVHFGMCLAFRTAKLGARIVVRVQDVIAKEAVSRIESRWNAAYPGGLIASYYRVPCGFKLSRYVKVPRELSSSLNGGLARLLTPSLPYIRQGSTDVAESPTFVVPHVLRPSIVQAEITWQPVCTRC